VKNYLPTAGLVTLAAGLTLFPFLDCQGPPSIFNYSCPIGLELSGYLSGNQLVVDSKGTVLVIAAGLVHYYVRNIFRALSNREGCVKAVARSYLLVTDLSQFDLLSLFPYALIQSENPPGTYITFYRYNPIVPLTFIAITLGTYKENCHAK
jgi:hypothetical protein